MKPHYNGKKNSYRTSSRNRKKRWKLQTLKSKVKNYVLSDCNSSGIIVAKKSNIEILADHINKEIIVKAKGNGKICLHTLSPEILQEIVSNEDVDYTVKIDD